VDSRLIPARRNQHHNVSSLVTLRLRKHESARKK